jgi:peptide methionine sulfoxide reductase MsrA
MNPDAVHTWQSLIHRKVLNLKRFNNRIRGEMSPMVKYWTSEQEHGAWIKRLKHSCEAR